MKRILSALKLIVLIALVGMDPCRWCGRGRIGTNDLCEHCQLPFDPPDMG